MLLPVALLAASLAGTVSLASTVVGAPALASAEAAVAGEPLYAFNSGLVLTVSASPARGDAVRIETDSGTGGQRWVLSADQTVRPAGNRRLCLDVPGGSYRAGVKLQLWACNGRASERFVTTAPSAHTPVFFLAAAGDRKLCATAPLTAVLDTPEIRVAGHRVRLARCAGAQGQAWSATSLASTVGQFAQFTATDTDDLVVADQGAAGTAAGLDPGTNSLDEQWEATASGGGWLLSPVDDTANCLTIEGTARLTAALRVEPCTGSSAQVFTMIYLRITVQVSYNLFAADDASYCIEPGTASRLYPLSAVLGRCPDTATVQTRFWMVTNTTPLAYTDLDPATTGEFQQFLDEPQTYSNGYAMTADGTKSGSAVSLANPPNAIGQTWTDITPGTLTSGNPDGSISIRPLNELGVCLTVPGGNDTAGQALQVQTCNGGTDQEFTVAQEDDGPDVASFSPYSAPGLCLGPEGSVAAGEPIVLQTCGSPVDPADTWGGWNNWSAW